MKTNEIEQLVGRFLSAETTLAEEQQLYDYFQGGEVAPELAGLREMFCDYAALPFGKSAELPARKPAVASRKWLQLAASVVLLLGMAVSFQLYQNLRLERRYAGSYMMVDGKRIDNLRQMRLEIEQTLADASAIEAAYGAQSVIESVEADVVKGIDDPQEREKILRILKD
ncbi:MAG: hypothetical protein IJ196_07595 [Prevotella sp.]|nr:hypothetical protein [Prevotella sp.]